MQTYWEQAHEAKHKYNDKNVLSFQVSLRFEGQITSRISAQAEIQLDKGAYERARHHMKNVLAREEI